MKRVGKVINPCTSLEIVKHLKTTLYYRSIPIILTHPFHVPVNKAGCTVKTLVVVLVLVLVVVESASADTEIDAADRLVAATREVAGLRSMDVVA